MKQIVNLLMIFIVVFSIAGCSGFTNTQQTGTEITTNKEVTEKTSAVIDDFEQKHVIKFTGVHNMKHPVTQAMFEFAKYVKDETDGRITVEVYAGITYEDEKGMLERLKNNEVDAMVGSFGVLSNYLPELNIFCMPYMFDNSEHMWRVLDSEMGDSILDKLSDSVGGAVALTYFDAGTRNFYTNGKRITSLEDLKGLKIRVQNSPVMFDLITALEAEAVVMGFDEVEMGFEVGVIDGAENNLASYEGMNHYKYAKYYAMDSHVVSADVLFVSEEMWSSLSKEDQEILKHCAEKTSVFQREEWIRQEEEIKNVVTNEGCVITEIENIADFQSAVAPLYEKYASGYEELIEQIKDKR